MIDSTMIADRNTVPHIIFSRSNHHLIYDLIIQFAMFFFYPIQSGSILTTSLRIFLLHKMKLHHYDPWPRAGPDIGPQLLSIQELGHDGSSVKTRWKMLEVQPGKIMTMRLHCIITNTQLQDSNISFKDIWYFAKAKHGNYLLSLHLL